VDFHRHAQLHPFSQGDFSPSEEARVIDTKYLRTDRIPPMVYCNIDLSVSGILPLTHPPTPKKRPILWVRKAPQGKQR
jgi:hypothetical protein